MTATIRHARIDDAAAIAAIYNHYIEQTCITFETEAISATDIAQRMAAVHDAGLPWLVAEHAGQCLGYSYAAPWKSRYAYRFCTEASIYLCPGQSGHGTGRLLYAALLDALRIGTTHTVLGCIALPNDVSVALHERLGFRKVAHFTEVGYKQERWIDVGYWQLLLRGKHAAPANL